MSLAFLGPAVGGDAPPASSPFERQARAAGARFAVRDGWRVATDYGSCASELTACRARVGLIDVSCLAKLQLHGPPDVLRRVIVDATGSGPDPGFALWAHRAWWCPVAPDRLLVLARAEAGGLVRERLADANGSTSLLDVTAGHCAVMLAGPRAREVLARVTALDVREQSLPECGLRPGSIARVPGVLVHTAPDRFLTLFGAGHAAYIWTALTDASRPLGGALAGLDALDRLQAAHA
jgi:heterotetrameric sarcosine oxidase gamma subunit